MTKCQEVIGECKGIHGAADSSVQTDVGTTGTGGTGDMPEAATVGSIPGFADGMDAHNRVTG